QRIEAQQLGQARLGHTLPYGPELAARALPAALGQTRGQRHRVDGAGAGGADGAELNRLILEQAVEHAPGEGAVRPPALERKIEVFGWPKQAQWLSAPDQDRARTWASIRASSWQTLARQHNRYAVDHHIASPDAVSGGEMVAG